jgi:hypothetical protein
LASCCCRLQALRRRESLPVPELAQVWQPVLQRLASQLPVLQWQAWLLLVSQRGVQRAWLATWPQVSLQAQFWQLPAWVLLWSRAWLPVCWPLVWRASSLQQVWRRQAWLVHLR